VRHLQAADGPRHVAQCVAADVAKGDRIGKFADTEAVQDDDDKRLIAI
jgi:hypothetical protein